MRTIRFAFHKHMVAISLLCFAGIYTLKSQNSVSIGTGEINSNAVLQLVSQGNNQGFLVPQLATSDRLAMQLPDRDNGMLVFDKDLGQFFYWHNRIWNEIANGSVECDFSNGGEAGRAERTLGNTDNYGLGFLTNNNMNLYIDNDGYVGIGTADPNANLQIAGDLRIGLITDDNGSTEGYGSKLYFSGGDDWPDKGDSENSDELWMARYNVASDNSELRINIGDEWGDKFIVGRIGCCEQIEGLWESFLTVNTAGTVGINTSDPGGLLGLKNNQTWLDVDDSNNLTFTDAVTGTKTLAELAAGDSCLWEASNEGIYNNGRVGIGNIGIASPELNIALEIDGDIRVGRYDPSVSDVEPNWGKAVVFSGAQGVMNDCDNTDPLWMARYNITGNESQLRIILGDGNDGNNKLVLGSMYGSGGFDKSGTWRPVFAVQDNGMVGIGTVNPAGMLDVNGTIYQRGDQIHADYVFENGYALESIEEHADFMWRQKHLKGVPEARKDENGQDIVEYGSHLNGILEELEKAHVYIEQLNKRIEELERKLEQHENTGAIRCK